MRVKLKTFAQLCLIYVGTATLTINAQANPNAIVVTIGGYESCTQAPGTGHSPYRTLMWRRLDSELSPMIAAQTGAPAISIATCYDMTQDNVISFKERTSASDAESGFNVFPMFDLPTLETFAPVIDWVVKSVQEFASQVKDPKIYFVGHSYGAWTSLQAASQLLAMGEPVRSIFTIDAISPILCNPRAYLVVFPWVPKECNVAPQDISHETRSQLLESLSNRWFHFYENQQTYLHSAAIPELEPLKQNFLFSFSNEIPVIGDEHKMLSGDPRVWRIIEEQVLSDLK